MSEVQSDERDNKQLGQRREGDWQSLGLHAWLSVARIQNTRRPFKPNNRLISLDEDQRRSEMKRVLRLEETSTREIVDVVGNRIFLDEWLEKTPGSST